MRPQARNHSNHEYPDGTNTSFTKKVAQGSGLPRKESAANTLRTCWCCLGIRPVFCFARLKPFVTKLDLFYLRSSTIQQRSPTPPRCCQKRNRSGCGVVLCRVCEGAVIAQVPARAATMVTMVIKGSKTTTVVLLFFRGFKCRSHVCPFTAAGAFSSVFSCYIQFLTFLKSGVLSVMFLSSVKKSRDAQSSR